MVQEIVEKVDVCATNNQLVEKSCHTITHLKQNDYRLK